jgi:hypothetical protein
VQRECYKQICCKGGGGGESGVLTRIGVTLKFAKKGLQPELLNRGDQNRRYFKQVALQTEGVSNIGCSKRDRRISWCVVKKGCCEEEVIKNSIVL